MAFFMGFLDDNRYRSSMCVKQCHTPPMTGNGFTSYKNCDFGDGLALLYPRLITLGISWEYSVQNYQLGNSVNIANYNMGILWHITNYYVCYNENYYCILLMGTQLPIIDENIIPSSTDIAHGLYPINYRALVISQFILGNEYNPTLEPCDILHLAMANSPG